VALVVACAVSVGLTTGAAGQRRDPRSTPTDDLARDQEARALFEAGRVAFDHGRFEDALGHFRRAHELSGRPQLLYNIGAAADKLRLDEVALEAFRGYLTSVPSARNRAEVEARIAVLERTVARQRELAAAAETAPRVTAPVAGSATAGGATASGETAGGASTGSSSSGSATAGSSATAGGVAAGGAAAGSSATAGGVAAGGAAAGSATMSTVASGAAGMEASPRRDDRSGGAGAQGTGEGDASARAAGLWVEGAGEGERAPPGRGDARRDEGGGLLAQWWFWTIVGAAVAGTVVLVALAASGDTRAPLQTGSDGGVVMTLRFP
jgi:hypothetical protein